MAVDHYQNLGVRRDADERAIHDAYRRGAKTHHPDSPGGGDARRFRGIQEAYETLRDPELRQRYDETLAAPAVASPRQRPREPGPPAGASTFGVPGHRLEIVLTPWEASRGVILPLEVPMRRPCGWCGGWGLGSLFCAACGGWGFVEGAVDLSLRLPSGLRDGSTVVFRVDTPGGPCLEILAEVRVEAL